MPRALIPNSTQIPDIILDHWMSELSGAEFKVLLYIARRTYGFGKESDTISLSQIAHGIARRDGSVLDRGTGASRSSVARSLKELEERGLIIRKTNLAESGREYEENTYQINLDWEAAADQGRGEATSGGGKRKGVVSKSDHLGSKRDYPVSKNGEGWSQDGTRVVSKSDPQETVSQETEQETAAAEKPADAELIELLVQKGVGRSVAVRLARQKPDQCRKQLAWLPFAIVKTTPGTWLANAIEHEFGPPKGVPKQRDQSRAGQANNFSDAKATSKPQGEPSEETESRLRSNYSRLEKTQPAAIAAFKTFFQGEREKAMKFAATLTAKGREQFHREAESEEFRLSLFDRWLGGEGKKYRGTVRTFERNETPRTDWIIPPNP